MNFVAQLGAPFRGFHLQRSAPKHRWKLSPHASDCPKGIVSWITPPSTNQTFDSSAGELHGDHYDPKCQCHVQIEDFHDWGPRPILVLRKVQKAHTISIIYSMWVGWHFKGLPILLHSSRVFQKNSINQSIINLWIFLRPKFNGCDNCNDHLHEIIWNHDILPRHKNPTQRFHAFSRGVKRSTSATLEPMKPVAYPNPWGITFWNIWRTSFWTFGGSLNSRI